MRLLFLLLLFANLVFFAWSAGYFGAASAGHEPQRLTAQKFPEKLHIIVPEPVAAPAPEEKPFCKTVSGVAAAAAEQFKADVAKMEGLKLTLTPVRTPARIEVQIGPLADEATAEARRQEALNLAPGQTFRVEPGSDGKFAVVLQEFAAEAPANDYLQDLKKKGLKTLKVVVRQTAQSTAHIQITGAAALLPQVQAPLAKLGDARVEECTPQ